MKKPEVFVKRKLQNFLLKEKKRKSMIKMKGVDCYKVTSTTPL